MKKLMRHANRALVAGMFAISILNLSLIGVPVAIQQDASIDQIEDIVKKEAQSQEGLPLSLFMLFFNQSKIPVPIKTAMDKVTMHNVVYNRTATSIKVGASGQFSGLAVQFELQIERGAVRGNHFKIALPQGFKLSKLLPSIKTADVFIFPASWLIISDYDYIDPSFTIPVFSGATFIATINKKDLTLNNEIANKIAAAVGSVIDKFTLYTHIPETAADLDLLINVPVPEQREVALSEVFPFDSLSLPVKVKTALHSTKIIKPVMTLTIVQSKLKDLLLEGGVNLFGQQFILKLIVKEPMPGTYIAPGTGTYAMSGTFIAKSNWKFGDLIPELRFLDGIQLADSSFVMSNFDYEDKEFNIDIKAGFNIKAGVALTGVLKDVKAFADKILSNKKLQTAGGMSRYIATDNLAIYCSAYLAADLKNIKVAFEIPVQIGIDFYELFKEGKLKSKPIINKITTSGFKFALETAIDRMALSGETGIYLYPSTQQNPLLFAGGLSFKTNGVELYGFMKGAYEPAFGLSWLSFGTEHQPTGLSFFFDYGIQSAAAIFGIPLPTGIKLAGAIGLGKKGLGIAMQGIAAFEITSAAMSSFFISGKIAQIDFGQLVGLLASLGSKKIDATNIPQVPTLKFSDLELTVAPLDTVIFDTQYRAGIFASTTIEMSKFKGGGKIALTAFDQRLTVDAYLNPSQTPIFVLTGQGADKKLGTVDDKARFEIDIAAGTALDKQKVTVDGVIKIPPLGCQGGMLFDFSAGNMNGYGLVSLFNGLFAVDSRLSASLYAFDQWNFSATFKGDFDKYFIDGLMQGFQAFKDNAQKDVKRYEDKMKDALTNLDLKAQSEIDKRKKRLEEINQGLALLKLKSEGSLSVAGPHNIYIYNHTNKTLHCAIYYVSDKDKPKELSVLAGKIITLKPFLKYQMLRPDTKMRYDRELYFTEDKALLTPTMNGSHAKKLQRCNAGVTNGPKYHITYDRVFNVYTREQWISGPGLKVAELGAEKAAILAYLEAILKPGVKVSEEVLKVLRRLKMVPEVFVKISEEVINAVLKSTQIVKIRQATLAAAAQELLLGALPKISVNFEFALPGKQPLKISIKDLQFDIKAPFPFFSKVASIVMLQVIPQFKNLIKDIEDMPEYRDAITVEDL